MAGTAVIGQVVTVNGRQNHITLRPHQRHGLRRMLRARPGSSQPAGLPVSTAQKRQARVQTLPISISVAVPLFQHSPMFGQMDSSQTVLRRCSRTLRRTAAKAGPVGQLRPQPVGLALRAGTSAASPRRAVDAVLHGAEARLSTVLLAAADDGYAFEFVHLTWISRSGESLFSQPGGVFSHARGSGQKKPGTKAGQYRGKPRRSSSAKSGRQQLRNPSVQARPVQ